MDEMLEAERTAHDMRMSQIVIITDKEDKAEELQKDVTKWKDKYRRRVKAFVKTTRDLRRDHDYLTMLDHQYDDLSQAGEFLQDCYIHQIREKSGSPHELDSLNKEKHAKEQDLEYQTKVYQETRQAVLTAVQKAVQEAQDDEIRRRRVETETTITQEIQARAIAREVHQVDGDAQDNRRRGQFKMGNLKKVELSKFDGKLKEYFRWKSTFDVLVHHNEGLDDNAKFLYLDQALAGEAHKIVEHLEHSGRSYGVAKSLLEKKYGGAERQIQHLYNTIREIRVVKDFHTLQDFQYTLLGIETMIANYRLDKEGLMLHLQLCEKMHPRYMKEYLSFLDRSHKAKGLKSLISYVDHEIEISQAAYEATSGQFRSNAANTDDRIKKRAVNSVNKTKSKYENKCADCGDSHAVWRCDVFRQKPVNDRLKLVKKEALCFVCLGKGHNKGDCHFKMRCDVEGCQGGHHRLLHYDKEHFRGAGGTTSGEVGRSNRDSIHSDRVQKRGNQKHDQEDKERPLQADRRHSEDGNTEVKKTINSVNVQSQMKRTVLNLVPVYVFKNNGRKKIRCLALLDSGSNTTLISDNLKKQLGLHGRKETHIYHQPIQGTAVKREVEVLEVKLESLENNFTLMMKEVETMPGQLQADAVDWNNYKTNFQYLENITFPDIKPHEKADLLIGADQSILFQRLDQRVPAKNGDPIAIETPLGWICMGIVPGYRTVKQVHACFQQEEEEVSSVLRRFWEVDTFHTCDSTTEMSLDSREVLQKTRASTTYNGERYQVAMPFNDRKVEEPSEEFKEEMWKMAMKRLESTEAKLKKSKEEIKDKYQEVLDGYLEKGYARIAPDPENTKWLLPHFAVVRDDKETSKVRIVFDGAAKVKNMSLNEQIHEGPKLQRDILQVLMRFRRYEIALNCDIREMFLGISVTSGDSKYLRILWRRLENRKPDVIEILRVTFGINASPFLANNTLLDHAAKYKESFPRAVEALVESTYVDDTLDSVKTVPEATKLYQQITRICQEAGWRVHKWCSNSDELLQHVPEEDRAQGRRLEDNVLDSLSVKTLGVKWLPESDEFAGEATQVDLNGKKITKRIVLQKVAKIFDPLGMMSPYVMQCKMILQEIWRCGKDWDDELDGELRKMILAWFNELQYANHIRHPRVLLLNPDRIKKSEIHCFTDASERAYGAVVYLKVIYEGEVVVRWVTAKGKVCPLEPISIPRLELMAAVLGASITAAIRKSLDIEGLITRMWTDSMTVIWWIIGRARNLKLFVANRVMEIHKYTEPSQWRHVPGDQNPADIISRGCTLQELRDSDLWKSGPAFMKKDVNEWPVQVKQSTRAANEEVKKQYLEQFVNQMIGSTQDTDCEEDQDESEASYSNSDSEDSEDSDDDDLLVQKRRVEHIQDTFDRRLEREENFRICGQVKQLKVESNVDYLVPERYSNIKKLVRVRAYVKRFLHNIGVPQKERTTGCLRVWELEESEKEIIANAQRGKFVKEYKTLVKGKTVDANSKLVSLNPQLDEDGLIRVGGRLRGHPTMPWEMQCPVILPKQSHVTDLIIRREHENNHMFGTNYLMGRLKEKFWIQSARSQIKFVTSRCMKCKRLKYKTMCQQMGLLPAVRTQMNFRAFVNAGVDFAGPIMVKIGRGKPQHKRWICVFTCLATRAVHLELCCGLDTDSFLNAMTRFIGRRGVPEIMVSDNGTNFRGADHEIKKLYDIFESSHFQDHCSQKRINWRFNPPGAPHHGGVFEAMVKATKTALREVLQKRNLTEEELQTALISAEGLINQRPLTYVGSEQEEFILTPNHFLHGSLGGMLAPDVLDGTPTFQKRWRMVQELLKEIWSRWLREWVAELNKRKKWHSEEENLKVGDVVLIIEEDLSKGRGNFPLARVIETNVGPDGLVRSCRIKTAKGQISTKIINKLAKIESTDD